MIRPHAYILAGGRSSRFGADKAWALLDGKSLILHARDALDPFAQSVTAVAEAPGRFQTLGLRTIADETPHLGPLGGLAAALADAPKAELVLVTACDLMLSSADPVRHLLAAATPADDAIAMRGPDGWRPFPALCHPRLLPIVLSRLAGEDRSLRSLLARHGRAIDAGGSFEATDCNTPGALSEARQRLRQRHRAAARAKATRSPNR